MPNVSRFLQRIAQIESSGGKNFNHPVVNHGVQAGTAGIGRYGLMPNTVKEIINRRRLAGTISPELHDLDQLDPVTMKAQLESNPELEDSLAGDLANKVLTNHAGDENRAAYSWTNGSNLTPDRISDEQLQNSPYVQKFNKVTELMDSQVNKK